jgi:hypothetical protein
MEAGMIGRVVDYGASITSNGRAGIVSAGSPVIASMKAARWQEAAASEVLKRHL